MTSQTYYFHHYMMQGMIKQRVTEGFSEKNRHCTRRFDLVAFPPNPRSHFRKFPEISETIRLCIDH